MIAEKIKKLLSQKQLSLSAIVKECGLPKKEVEKEMKNLEKLGEIEYAGGRMWKLAGKQEPENND